MSEKLVWHEEKKIKIVSLCAPATRIVYVFAYQCNDDPRVYTDYQHVVAIRTTVSDIFKCQTRESQSPQRATLDAEDMGNRGWLYDCEDVVDEPLVVEDGLLVPAGSMGSGNDIATLVAAPWPYEDDGEKLMCARDEVTDRFRDRLKRDEMRKAKQP